MRSLDKCRALEIAWKGGGIKTAFPVHKCGDKLWRHPFLSPFTEI